MTEQWTKVYHCFTIRPIVSFTSPSSQLHQTTTTTYWRINTTSNMAPVPGMQQVQPSTYINKMHKSTFLRWSTTACNGIYDKLAINQTSFTSHSNCAGSACMNVFLQCKQDNRHFLLSYQIELRTNLPQNFETVDIWVSVVLAIEHTANTTASAVALH